MTFDIAASGSSPHAEHDDERRPLGASGGAEPDGGAEAPYGTAWEHVKDELRRLDRRLGLRARDARSRRPNSQLDAFRGLVISAEEVSNIVDSLPAARGDADARGDTDERGHPSLAELDRRIEGRLAATARAGIELPLLHLSRLFGLTRLEEQCLIFSLAPEIDRRYEKLYGYLQDDVTQKRPCVGWLLDVLCATADERLLARRSFDPQAPLSAHRLLRIAGGPPDDTGSLLSRSLSLDDRMVDFLLGRQRMDARLDDIAHLVPPDEAAPLVASGDFEGRIRGIIEAHWAGARPPQSLLFYLYGPDDSERKPLVEATCHALGIPLIVANLERIAAGPLPFSEAVRLIAREAILLPAALCFEHLDALLDDPGKGAPQLHCLLDAARLGSQLTFLLGRRAWVPEAIGDGRPFFGIDVASSGMATTRAAWEAQARRSSLAFGDVDWGSLASRFRLGSGQIRDVLMLAGHKARWRSPDGGTIHMADLNDACRAIAAKRLSSLARKVEARQTWGELILPPASRSLLEDLCDQARHQDQVLGAWGFAQKLPLGRGLTALFCGPPGTGKTMAAQVIASELSLDLYRIDLSQVVSKYIGETEKNLRQVFDDAEATRAILFFDEADALFGKRSEVKDAHDRYANIEVGYLLQRMEEFEGIAILATNLRQNLDEAFTRRIRFLVEFPFPDEEQRRRIWQVTFPAGAPLDADVDFGLLAREVRLAGGHIRNIALSAAFYAAGDGGAISLEHLVRAAAREYEKVGKTWVSPIQGRARTDNTKGTVEPS